MSVTLSLLEGRRVEHRDLLKNVTVIWWDLFDANRKLQSELERVFDVYPGAPESEEHEAKAKYKQNSATSARALGGIGDISARSTIAACLHPEPNDERRFPANRDC
jgi:hypothetical protein